MVRQVRALAIVVIVFGAAGPDVRVVERRQPLVQERGIVFEGLVGVEYMREHFVLDLNELESLFCNIGTGCGHGGHGMAFVQDFVVGHDVVAQKPHVVQHAFSQIDEFARRLHQIRRCNDPVHPR